MPRKTITQPLAAEAKSPRKPKTDEDRWNFAVDWLLNSRHTADPDIQEPFWAYVDGFLSLEELREATAATAVQAKLRRSAKVTR